MCIISLFVPYANVSIESFGCILLSSLTLSKILLLQLQISLVKTCFSLLKVCGDFNINLLFLWILYDFIEDSSYQVYFFNNIFPNLMGFRQCSQLPNLSFFLHFAFLFSTLASTNNYTFLVSIKQVMSLFFHLIQLFWSYFLILNPIFFYFYVQVMVCLILCLKYQIFFHHPLACLSKFPLFFF